MDRGPCRASRPSAAPRTVRARGQEKGRSHRQPARGCPVLPEPFHASPENRSRGRPGRTHSCLVLRNGVAGILALAYPPRDGGDPGSRVAVTQELEGTQLDDLGREVLTYFTRGRRKSKSTSGAQNGARKAPLAPSTWMSMSRPVSACSWSRALAIASTGS